MRFSINCSTVNCSPTVEFAILREATSKTYGPRVYLPSYYFPINLLFLFFNLYFPIYTTKIPKIFILLSLSDLTFASGLKWLTTPLSRWLQGSWLLVQVLGDLRVTSYWIDTLVLKNWGKYLRYCAATPFRLQGKTNTCSRGSTECSWCLSVWNDAYGITRIPTTVAGAQGREKSRNNSHTRILYPGSGREDA